MEPLAQLEVTLADCFAGARLRRLDPDDPRFESHGEIESPRGLGPRLTLPERGGLLCCRIFGTVRPQSCVCTKYRGATHLGITCEKCGVLVAEVEIRRERFGHISLPVAIEHPWDPSRPLERLLVLPAGYREQPPDTAHRPDLGGLNGLYQRVLRQGLQLSRCLEHAAPSIIVDHEADAMRTAIGRLFGTPRRRPGRGPTLADHLHRIVLAAEPGREPPSELVALLASADLTLD